MNGPDTAKRDEQRVQLLSEIEELKANRLSARRDARSGNPAKSATGKQAAAEITSLINQRHGALGALEDEN
jgi:hypothetical protein